MTDQAKALAALQFETHIPDGPKFRFAQFAVSSMPVTAEFIADILQAIPKRALEAEAKLLGNILYPDQGVGHIRHSCAR